MARLAMATQTTSATSDLVQYHSFNINGRACGSVRSFGVENRTLRLNLGDVTFLFVRKDIP
ncbi:MAG: hypothetical protein HY314_00150 [Acidobacteria bacterium]|nr:hypothetical protein [Acidobacteriota bacterium]